MNKEIESQLQEHDAPSFKSKVSSLAYFIKEIFSQDKMALIGTIIFILFIIVALMAPTLAPHDPMEIHRRDGEIVRTEPPSSEFPFGTTNRGRCVFSQVIMGSRVALLVGALAALLVTIIGSNIGLISGYYGGWIDNLFMRIVDISYAIPFIPFTIILVTLLRPSIWNIILAIVVLTWRTIARVLRAQVLSVKERPYVKAAKVAGASNARIIFLYILPNVLPLALLEMSLRMAQAIVAESTVSFLGFGDPDVISWGRILQEGFIAGAMREAWWWVIPPGLAIAIVVVSVFFSSRALEFVANPQLRRR
ncbi:ABC transporter permease [Natranaerobius thermophilus]|uniref:Binding-protein-dependent transport systems inner membrane component n=1 Tax=Natranaerobius thermophilus (strain ATCC BAA-1301 / DSM 18059 / JW/NM-WN-LF) TaxID=457570 RepID=B2A0S5_NATTJ|nr:ABC transporter permease [Natranaerobius thermophilus]ACB85955.1 binding-protein-dependent transport systems inner membrane component [Natranaerobius thermophilus JW/NM-WN-LF]